MTDLATLANAAGKVGASAQGQFDWTTLVTSALVAAVISALLAIIGQWVARENAKLAAQISQENSRLSANLEVAKTLAESRQEWINILREDMAQFAGLSAKRSRVIVAGEVFNDGEFEKMVAVGARIRMRLDPKDADFDELLRSMSECSLEKEPGALGKAASEFVRVSQRILKREWEVLKTELRKLKTIEETVG